MDDPEKAYSSAEKRKEPLQTFQLRLGQEFYIGDVVKHINPDRLDQGVGIFLGDIREAATRSLTTLEWSKKSASNY